MYSASHLSIPPSLSYWLLVNSSFSLSSLSLSRLVWGFISQRLLKGRPSVPPFSPSSTSGYPRATVPLMLPRNQDPPFIKVSIDVGVSSWPVLRPMIVTWYGWLILICILFRVILWRLLWLIHWMVKLWRELWLFNFSLSLSPSLLKVGHGAWLSLSNPVSWKPFSPSLRSHQLSCHSTLILQEDSSYSLLM